MLPPRPLTIDTDRGPVSALYLRPRGAHAMYLFAHGAGAGMDHEFMSDVAQRLAERGIATLRYNFPYREAGRKAPDSASVLEGTVRRAAAEARRLARGLPLVAGGKSMGGRMTARAHARDPLPKVLGLAFLGFPLHAPGKEPKPERSAHLEATDCPLLFVQGTRDSLADLGKMRALVKSLGRRAKLHVVEGGEHSFKVLKRSGRDQAEVLDEVADAVANFIDKRVE